jgi:uncharacterized protein YbjT (DUF2867 family)
MNEPEVPRTALLVGATGLVGKQILQQLLAHPAYTHVKALARKPQSLGHPKLEWVILADFENLESLSDEVFGVTDVYLALGTTHKQAGNNANFRRIDHDYPLIIAKRAAAQGALRCALVSSTGTQKDSPFHYVQVKWDLEQALKKLEFARLVIAPPGLLLGERPQMRMGEKIGEGILVLLKPILWLKSLRRYRPIHDHEVAQALIHLTLQAGPIVQIVENETLLEISHANA